MFRNRMKHSVTNLLVDTSKANAGSQKAMAMTPGCLLKAVTNVKSSAKSQQAMLQEL